MSNTISIQKTISQLDKFQQIKLLEFINSMIHDYKHPAAKLLKYAGSIETKEIKLIANGIKDCEKIDGNEW